MSWKQTPGISTLLAVGRRIRQPLVVRRSQRREARLRTVLGLPVEPAKHLRLCVPAGSETSLAAPLVTALADALAERHELPAFAREIEGMSGQRYRTFINRLVNLHPDPHYLEIGSWAGSTAVAAIVNNTVSALCIDNWSLFGGPKDLFFKHIELARSPRVTFRFLECDFRSVDYSRLPPCNIYLFDGPHLEQDHYDGVRLVQPALAERHVLIVDDWNWSAVRLGTLRALADCRAQIHCCFEVRTTQDETHAPQHGKASDWHNGYFVAEVGKGAH